MEQTLKIFVWVYKNNKETINTSFHHKIVILQYPVVKSISYEKFFFFFRRERREKILCQHGTQE